MQARVSGCQSSIRQITRAPELSVKRLSQPPAPSVSLTSHSIFLTKGNTSECSGLLSENIP